MLPGPVTIFSTATVRLPEGPATTALARAAIIAGTLSAAGEAFVQPEARYELTTHSRIEAGFDLFLGPDGTFFGDLSENNRFYLRLRLAF